MTREDAIDIIQSILNKYEEDECLVTEITIGDEDIKAFKMAIKTLEQELTKNDLAVDCISRADALALYCDKCGLYNCISKCASYRAVEKMPSVTPQLSVPEVTALAEWIEKLTKECEEAYNKGYADGVKSVNICPYCWEYIGEEE